MAKRAVENWGEGKTWDNARELQITRYFRKTTRLMELGDEVFDRNDPGIFEKVWLRYAEFEVSRKQEE